jgi:type IV pilus biogenesis protein CpaD/CtpE
MAMLVALAVMRPKILLVPYKWVMKTPSICLMVLAVASSLLSGCASQKESVTETTTDQTEKRVHTQEELRKTGETQTGPALEKADAAVRTSHP